ncbi:uncharacterized protein LOC144644064 isoform X1 [Oculina patagonica]
MGAGASHRKHRKVELQKFQSSNKTSNFRDVNNFPAAQSEPEEKTNFTDMETLSVIAEAERNVNVLKSHLSERTLASKKAVTCCVELLKFSCSMDEDEEIKTAALNFVMENDIPLLIFQVYGALLTKYPDAVKYDREKDKETENKYVTEELQQAQDVLNVLAGFTVNLTDFPQLAVKCGSTGLIQVFLEMTDALKDSIPDMIPFEDPETKTITQFTSRGRTLSRVLGLLVNLAKQVSNRTVFIDSNGVQHLLPFLKSQATAYYIKSLFCLAYLIEEDNNETIMADAEPIKFIIAMLEKASKSSTRDYLGFSASDIADGISKLAVNESNSKQFGLNGGIPTIVNMLKTSQQDSEKLCGTKALWMLSFDITNRALIKAIPSAIETLQNLTKHPNKDVVKASQGVLWEIERNRDFTSSVPTKTKHIMISYQWDCQDTIVQVKDKLRSAGFNVWIDIEEMKGSTLESMASAVECCTVFLMAISRKYFESPNCRAEAEYAYQLRKQIIPLMMEPRFHPSGWLGIIMGTKLWTDFREARNFEAGTSHLIRELGKGGKSQGNEKDKSKEDDLKKTLMAYKKKHRSIYVYLSEGEKLIRSLRSFLMSGQLATEAAYWKADALVALYTKIPDQESRTLVVNFLIDVNLHETLIDIVRTLRQKYPQAFSGEKKSEVSKDNEEKKINSKKKANAKPGSGDDKQAEVKSEANWALEVMLSISISILNLTDLHDAFCEVCGNVGLVKECLELSEQLKKGTPEFNDQKGCLTSAEDKDNKFSRQGHLIFEVLGVLHNLSKRTNNKKYFDNSSAVETLLSFFRTKFPVYRMTALLALAYLVDEKNNHLIMASEEPIKDILKLLDKASHSADRRSLGFSATEIALGLMHVATNDGNKRMIGQLGGIPMLVSMVKGPEEHEEERVAAMKALYMLSFDEANKEMIKADHDTMALLQSLQQSNNKEIQQAASGVIWEIQGKKEHSDSSDSEEHVMISYQWDTQETMLQVKQDLEAQGCTVWMDVEQMEGSILETMARAVEKSSVLLLAVSRKYQNSPNCRSEAEYAYQRRKRMIPLMMESNYSPDGWLGIVLGSKLWMDFRKDPSVGIQQLSKEISKARVAASKAQLVGSSSPKTATNDKVLRWKKEDVAKWLQDIGFAVGDNKVRGKLDGPLLHMLNELRKESPEFFYNSVKTDLGFPTVIEVLQFTRELKELLG